MIIGGEDGRQTDNEGQHIPRKNSLRQLVQNVRAVYVRYHGNEGDQVSAKHSMPTFDREAVVQLRGAEDKVRCDEVVGCAHG